MDRARLDALLNRFSSLRVLVVGDFFLDKYMVIDRRISEVSLETGLEASQVVGIRLSPGAAGTVTSNLRALGVKTAALGVIGGDGQGYELKGGLEEGGVDVAPLVVRADRFTPTYTKLVAWETDGREHEIQRLDIKNRSPLPAEVEDLVIARLRDLAPRVDGVIVADQVQEADCGVITGRVRGEIGELAQSHSGVVFAADSRCRIGLFRHVIIKPNAREAMLTVRPDQEGVAGLETARETGAELYRRNGKPVFLTVGAEGVLVFTEAGCAHVPALPAGLDEIDIVGAGDSFMAGAVSALCGGADPAEAAVVGNLVASVTIRQIGTTGTASPDQVRDRFKTASL